MTAQHTKLEEELQVVRRYDKDMNDWSQGSFTLPLSTSTPIKNSTSSDHLEQSNGPSNLKWATETQEDNGRKVWKPSTYAPISPNMNILEEQKLPTTEKYTETQSWNAKLNASAKRRKREWKGRSKTVPTTLLNPTDFIDEDEKETSGRPKNIDENYPWLRI